jgi:guanylate kinase
MSTATTGQQKGHLLFVVSAPSGAGKTSLCNEVLRQVPRLQFSVSHTTRQPRPGEQHGRDYCFISAAEFLDAVAQGRMAEWTEIYGNHYGTARETIQQAFDRGFDLFFDIDERGARQLAQAYPDIVTILVLPPSLGALKQRLIDRGTENGEALQRRLQQAEEEIGKMSWYRYVIVNDQLEEAVAQLKGIVLAERCRHNHDVVEDVLHGPCRPAR